MKTRGKNPVITIILLCLVAMFLLVYVAMNLISNESSRDNHQTPNGTIEVIDGDTFITAEGEIVRLLCIDTPEKNQEGYEEATDFLSERLFDAELRLEGNKTDAYGRSLRWVYVDDVLINKEIIDLGFGSLFEYENENCSLVE